MKKIYIIFPLLFLYLSSPVNAEELVEIWLWSNVEKSNDIRVLQITEHHACSGYIAKLKVTKMPSSNEIFEAEKVLELSSEGEIINTWYMPIDIIVLGVEGASIICGLGGARNKALKINTDGTLNYVPSPFFDLVPKDCPPSASNEIKGSDYLRCFEYQDLKTKTKRLLAYQGPCT